MQAFCKMLVVSISFIISQVGAEDYFAVNKKGVIYTFAPFDEITDRWVRNVFPHWEAETFDVFNQVKNPDGIAIDLGAWIGTTAIWLSRNFTHVVAVEADKISLVCLRSNLKASGCMNISISEKPIADMVKDVVFGPRGSQILNDSMSCIKDVPYHSDDYVVRSTTFKQLIDDYVYNDENLKSKKISFIKCDIEGGEENIIEDLLSFALQNKAKVYLSFHTDWWTTKKITDFSALFKLFKTNCPQQDLCEYIQQNPFASILFEG